MSDKPTLGQGTVGKGKGFQKRQLVEGQQIAVDPQDIARMQEGYETRIARQKEALDRMTALLEQRTQDVGDHMRRANDMASMVLEGQLGAHQTQVSDLDVDELLKMIPEDWDFYNEDDTPRTILAAYLRHCNRDQRDRGGKYEEAMASHAENTQTWDYIRPLMQTMGVAGYALPVVVQGVIEQLQRDLANARRDAQLNAERVNDELRKNAQVAAEHVGDIGADAEIPPDMREGGQSYVAPVNIQRDAGIPQPLEVQADADREVLSWDGMGDLTEGDIRPGKSF